MTGPLVRVGIGSIDGDGTSKSGEPNAIEFAIGYAKFFSRSHDAVIRVYDDAGNVIARHAQAGEFS